MATLKNRVLHGGPLPGFVNLHGKPPAFVCQFANSRRKLHLVTISVHGHPATAQAIVMRNYLNAVEELKGKGIIVYPVSSHRSCNDQKRACDGICGRGCAGCPGLCAPCGVSGHQYGICFDNHIAKHKGRTYAEAYQVYKHSMSTHGFDNFDGWENGSDTMHVSWRIVV